MIWYMLHYICQYVIFFVFYCIWIFRYNILRIICSISFILYHILYTIYSMFCIIHYMYFVSKCKVRVNTGRVVGNPSHSSPHFASQDCRCFRSGLRLAFKNLYPVAASEEIRSIFWKHLDKDSHVGHGILTKEDFKVNWWGIGQIIGTSHDLTSTGSWGREIPLSQGNLGRWNIIIWPDWTVF